MHPVRRTWHGTDRRRYAEVESQHPECGWLTRGTVRQVGLAGTDGPGLAGTLIWLATDYDGTPLDPITDSYVEAERQLLAATKELEN